MAQTATETNSRSPQRFPRLVLDPSLYNPARKEVDFLKSQTKIEDEEELKNHVIAIQKEAWDLVNYKCIQSFGFTRLRISLLPTYQDLLILGKERPAAIFLDFACCFGNDTRKAIADGYPLENVVASDLRKDFWNLGHKLYRSMPETFSVPFVQGNVFDPQHLAPSPPYYSPPATPVPDLSKLTLLTPLQGHVSAIHVSAFFHLFTSEDQVKAARALASLLSPLPGSMIFGTHMSLPVSAEVTHAGGGDFTIYNFSPEDWSALWDGEIFRKGSVIVEAEFDENARVDGPELEGMVRSPLVWSVKRI